MFVRLDHLGDLSLTPDVTSASRLRLAFAGVQVGWQAAGI